MERRSRPTAPAEPAINADSINISSENAQKGFSRNRIIGVSGVTAVLALGTAGLVAHFNRGSEEGSCTIPPPAFGLTETNSDVIQNVVENTDFSKNQATDELILWDAALLAAYPNRAPTEPEEIRADTKRILNVVINAMRESANPCFKNASNLLGKLESEERISFGVSELGESFAQAGIYESEGRVIWNIELNSDGSIFRMAPAEVAIILTHELDHIRNGENYRKANPNFSNREFIDEYSALMRDPQIALEEEARGYAEAAKAFVYVQALLGYFDSDELVHQRDAAQLIRCQRDEESNCWIGYMAEGNRTLLHK